MKFSLDKCIICSITKERKVKMEVIKLQPNVIIQEIAEEQAY